MSSHPLPAVCLLRRHDNGALLERWGAGENLRWRFHWGPSDIFISAKGEALALEVALERAWSCFLEILPGLVRHLARLREPVAPGYQGAGYSGSPVAERMHMAVVPFAQQFGLFITPMAAVAGSIAQELLACFQGPGITKAIVNNGGDIAFSLQAGERLRCAVFGDQVIELGPQMGAQGIATSGFGGRSLTLGVADFVTVVAASAASADAAATMIANAVNVDHPLVLRKPANQVRDDSDLGELPVTIEIGRLPLACVESALEAGSAFARRCLQGGLVLAVLLSCQGRSRALGSSGVFSVETGTKNECEDSQNRCAA